MKLTMNVLIITRNFYPYNNIGSFRINSFAKYFRKAGNSVTVVAEVNEMRLSPGMVVIYITSKTR